MSTKINIFKDANLHVVAISHLKLNKDCSVLSMVDRKPELNYFESFMHTVLDCIDHVVKILTLEIDSI